jgi:hypothetical protein
MISMTIILINLLALPSITGVPTSQNHESHTITMPSYTLNAPPGGDWIVDRDDRKESVNFQKESINPYTSSIMQVIKKTADRKKRDLGERELAEDFIREEEKKIRKELVEKRGHDFKAVKKGTTTIGGKKLYFMSYRAARNGVRVDAVLHVYFPENYKKMRAFYVFFASEAYLRGSHKPDLEQIHPLITSFKASDHVAPRQATTGDLLKAVNVDDIAQVKELLDGGLDVNGKNKAGWSALMIAASKGNMEMLSLLIEKGADVDEKNTQQGQTPLIFAAHWGHADVLRLLIEQGADVNIQMDDGWTALIDSISMDKSDVAKILIESGADINVKSRDGWTALIAAAYKNNGEIVSLLIKHGADVNAKNAKNRTALDLAKTKGYEEIVKLLMQHTARE